MITIEGLSPKQMALADIMWTISSKEGVDSFISTLPNTDAKTCRVLIELMQLAFLDEITNTQEANRVIDKFTL
jgi:hypothetical protein